MRQMLTIYSPAAIFVVKKYGMFIIVQIPALSGPRSVLQRVHIGQNSVLRNDAYHLGTDRSGKPSMEAHVQTITSAQMYTKKDECVPYELSCAKIK